MLREAEGQQQHYEPTEWLALMAMNEVQANYSDSPIGKRIEGIHGIVTRVDEAASESRTTSTATEHNDIPRQGGRLPPIHVPRANP